MSKGNNKRGKYNEKYNLDALNNLHLIMEDKEYWMTSLQLAEISGRNHDKVIQDIKRDIVEKVNELKKNIDVENFRDNKLPESLKEEIKENLESFKYQEKTYKDTNNRTQKMFILNRESSLICLVRYNFMIQLRVNALFLKIVDEKREEIEKKCRAYDTLVSGKGLYSMGE